MVDWYSWGYAKTQTYPPPSTAISLPATCDSCQLYTYEYCLACSAGTFSSTGASCLPCSPGSYSSAGASACTVCPAGYWATPTSTSCSPCINNPGAYVYTSPGTANNNCGLSSTPSCPSGTYADQPSGTCKSCMPGTFQATAVTSWGVCEICPAGSLCPSSGMVNANPCPAGFFSNSGSTVCTKICTSGQYAEIGMSVCSACAAGTAS